MIRHGDATGADSCANEWARMRFIKIDRCPVKKEDWNKYRTKEGKSYAGARRNLFMAEKNPIPFLAIFFPGKNGTKNMLEIAKRKGMIIEIQEHERFVAWSNIVKNMFF